MPTIKRSQFSERVDLGAGSVDTEAGVILSAKLIGRESANGRIYRTDALREAKPKYEGARINLDHPSRTGGGERKFTDWVGVVENVTEGSDGLYGDLNLRQKSVSYEEIMEAAETFPQHFGLSHVADCGYEVIQGVEHINEIEDVVSVDIVLEPATTSGLYESKGRKTMSKSSMKTLRHLVEGAPETSLYRKRLAEMIEGDVPAVSPEAEVAVAENASPEDAVRQGLLEAIAMKLETADSAALQSVLDALDLPTSAAEIAAGETSTESSGTSEESKKVRALESKLALLEAKDLLHEQGISPTEARVKALANARESDRQSLVESWPNNEAIRESRPARPTTSPPVGSRASGGGNAYEKKWESLLQTGRNGAPA